MTSAELCARFSLVFFVLMTSIVNLPAVVHGQSIAAVPGVYLTAEDPDDEGGSITWRVSKWENAGPLMGLTRLRELCTGVQIYAVEHDGQWPELASELFAAGYVTHPQAFYHPGDVDPVPVTIDNDIPDAPNSAMISFDFPGAGGSESLPTDTIMFADNNVANNAGLLRSVVFGDCSGNYLPVWPHPFMDMHVDVTQQSLSSIRRRFTSTSEPYPLDLPLGAVARAVAAPHHVEVEAQSLLTQDVLDVFAVEGTDVVNSYGATVAFVLVLLNAELIGPAGTSQPVTVYVQFESTLTRTPSEQADSTRVVIHSSWSDTDGQSNVTASVDLTDSGLLTSGSVVLVEEEELGPGDAAYVPDAVTVFIRGYAQLTFDVPIGSAGDIYISLFADSRQRLTASGPLGRLSRADVELDLPATPAIDQIKLYAPPGYALSVPDRYGPGDLAVLLLRGDHDLNGQVDASDRNSLIAAFTGPLVSVDHDPGTFHELQTFDFDGDADIDCTDYAAFVDAWTAAGEPDPFSPCLEDADGDGVPTADDDCPGTLPGAFVDARGCRQGDVDASGTVDIGDWTFFGDCMAGPDLRPRPTLPLSVLQCLNSFDYDADNDVDLTDYDGFQTVFGS